MTVSKRNKDDRRKRKPRRRASRSESEANRASKSRASRKKASKSDGTPCVTLPLVEDNLQLLNILSSPRGYKDSSRSSSASDYDSALAYGSDHGSHGSMET